MFSKIICRTAGLALSVWLFAANSFAQQVNYTPNSVYYCRLEKKFDSNLTGGIGGGTDTNGTEWQASFSPIEHGAVMINYFNAHRKGVIQQTAEGSSSQFAEFGLGAYESVARGTASIFIGYGQGAIFSNYHLNRTAAFNLERWFVQPAMVFQKRNFEWGFALRLSRLSYSHAEIDYSIAEYDLHAVQAIDARSPFFLPELGLHAGIVVRPFVFALNFTSLFYDATTYNFERLNSSFLLTLDLGAFYQKKKPVPTR